MIYTAADFDGQQAADYTLLIGVGAANNKLAVIDQAQQLKFAASYDPAAADSEVAALLDLSFGTVKLAVSDSRYTFIPVDVYDEQHHDIYLRYLPFDNVGVIRVADIIPLHIKLLHQTSRVGLEPFEVRFPDAGSYPFVQALLSTVAGQGIQTQEPLLVIERHSPWMTIGVFNEGKFIYCHDFEVTNIDDFTYHLLSTTNRFGLDDRRPTILLSGDIDLDDAYYERAAAYGEKVMLADSGALAGIQVPDDMIPQQHRFLTIFGLHQCV